MISRTTGPELGGAIGLLFYSAYSVGACFYAVGFAEVVEASFFTPPPHGAYRGVHLFLQVRDSLEGDAQAFRALAFAC